MISACHAQFHHGENPYSLSCLLRKTCIAISLRRCCLARLGAWIAHTHKPGRLRGKAVLPLTRLVDRDLDRHNLRLTQEGSRGQQGDQSTAFCGSESAHQFASVFDDRCTDVFARSWGKDDFKTISDVHRHRLSPNLKSVNRFGDNSRDFLYGIK